MTQNNGRSVLAIALDAAEPKFVLDLIERDEMPALKSLLAEGKWLRVQSPAYIGSGTVWPTFIAGQTPNVHGVYGEWLWEPDTMSLSRYRGRDLTPFWKHLSENGVSVGVLDVPFMPLIGLAEGFEISEWGPHDVLEGITQTGPERIAHLAASNSPHPLQRRVQVSGPDDYANLEALGSICLQGITQRGNFARNLIAATQPRFSLIAFTEIHRSSHYLWHKVDPNHSVYRHASTNGLAVTRPGMHEIFHEVDRQIGELVKTVGPESPVIVFSLHGMQPAHGTPAFLDSWLCEKGFAGFSDWKGQRWRDRARASFAGVKQSSPKALKKLYYKILPPAVTHQLARPTMMPLYDWSKTTAFSLPTDQHGWIRINLAGREARGIVPGNLYGETCDRVEEQLRSLRSSEGDDLVAEVVRTADSLEAAVTQRLPDLVVHWSDAVFASPLRIAGSNVEAKMVGTKYVGQHSREGFGILRDPAGVHKTDQLRAQDMHQLFAGLLGTQ